MTKQIKAGLQVFADCFTSVMLKHQELIERLEMSDENVSKEEQMNTFLHICL